jgi:RNA polymerase nonessential primary-like sigma factor
MLYTEPLLNELDLDIDVELELSYTDSKEDNEGRAPLSKDLFADYLKEIGRYPLLDRSQEVQLGTQVQEMMQYEEVRRKLGITLQEFIKVRRFKPKEIKRIYEIGERAKNKLITHNLRLVVSVARRYSTINLSIYDMVQEGNIGLIRGAEKYNPIKYDVKFSTYASWWIKESINKGITNGGRSIRLPVHVTDKIRVLRKAKRDFYVKYNRQPSVTELMELTGLSREILSRVSPYLNRPVSLDLKIEPDISLLDYIADPNISEVSGCLTQEHIENTIKELLMVVTEEERKTLCCLYGLFGGVKMDRIEYAKVTKVTPQRVGELERTALKKLQEEFGEVPEVKNIILSCLS